MPNLTSVGLLNGQATSGTGTVSTLDALMADGGQATLGSKSDARSAATDSTAISMQSVLKEISSCVQTLSAFVVALGQATMAGSSPVVIASDQTGAGFDFVPRTVAAMTSASSGNVANASAVAVLSGAANKRTYLSGVTFTATGATAVNIVTATIVGGAGAGALSYTFTFPAGVTTAATPLNIIFDPPLVSSANNTSFVITLPAAGGGNTNACVSCTGFVQ